MNINYYDEPLQKALAGNYNFSIKEIFSEAWKKVHGVKASIWGAIGIYVAIVLVCELILTGLSHINIVGVRFALQLIGFILTICVYYPMLAGILLIPIRWINNKEKSAYYVTRFWTKDYILRFFTMWLWMVLVLFIPIIIAGFLIGILHEVQMAVLFKAVLITLVVLLILFYIYLMNAFVFSLPLIVDRFLKGGEALNVSRKVVTYRWFKVFFLFLLVCIILILSAIPLGILLIWTLPWAYNVIAIAYRDIFGIAGKDPVSKEV